MSPAISIVIGCYNMPRELPRTIRSLSPSMQRIAPSDYELIVVDNGSTKAFDEAECRSWGAQLRVLRFEGSSPSPVVPINKGIRAAEGDLIGVLIDGARMASPGLIGAAAMANKISDRAIILTLGFHLGPGVQAKSMLEGYDQNAEDALLASVEWTEDGYRLFDISVFAGSSGRGWFLPIGESNAIFMRRALWEELGGLEEKFQSVGGGIANIDLLNRAVQLPSTTVVTLLGEGTFHQFHGGVATNARVSHAEEFRAEYFRIRGRKNAPPQYETLYFGSITKHTLRSVNWSAERKLNLKKK